MKVWNKSFDDLKSHYFSGSAYVAFLIASVINFADKYFIPRLFSHPDRSAFIMGSVVSGLVIILYIILYKRIKGELLPLFFLRKGARNRDRAIGFLILIILGLYIPLTFFLSYQLTYIYIKCSRLTYLSLFALIMGSVVSGLGIILYKWTKGELLRPFFLRKDERNRDRAIGFLILIILGIYIPLTFLLSSRFDLFLNLLRKSPFVRRIYLAPLSEEFTCRVLLPYAFLLTFARIPRFAKQEIWGLPLPLVVSHFLSALIFSSVHYGVHIGPFFDFYLFFRFFSGGIAFSCVFLIFFALTDSTTGYASAVLAHQYINWRLMALL
ncbi:MAG: hypothetical protein ACFFCW_17420 [Candidatus Hodarchaeota archaeon]